MLDGTTELDSIYIFNHNQKRKCTASSKLSIQFLLRTLHDLHHEWI